MRQGAMIGDTLSLSIFNQVNPQAMVVSEVINSDNITFLSPEGGVIQNADPDLNSPQFLCPFAAGHVYVNSVLDMLACQVILSPYPSLEISTLETSAW